MTLAAGPYVGLDYFHEEDAALFFGREAERKRIIGNLRASRLTLLYAESGVGKTSLLRAGVSARLRELAARTRHVPVVYSAWRGDPTAGLIDATEAALQLTLPHEALEHAIEDATAKSDSTPLFILDQFEEHFLYAADDEERFDDDLARCVTRRDLRANFLISVREDAYPLLGPRFKARIPNVYGNYLHLDFLDASAARDAVLEPIRALNAGADADAPRFEIEGALVDAVLEQVRRGRVTMGDDALPTANGAGSARIETAYLQLVMKRLWDEELAAGSQRLRLETLHRLGGAEAIVHGHLDDVLARLPADEQDAAAAAFRFLVTASGRKIALSSEELREFSATDSAALEPALEHLERARILRPVPATELGGSARHEIYHDVLAPPIIEWRRRHGEAQRSAETEQRLAETSERARRLEAHNRWLAAAVIVLAAVAIVALYLWNPSPVQRLELATVDTRFSVRGGGTPDPRLVIVAVDDATLRRFGGATRLPRSAYARMLERLRADRPAVIGLDVLFDSPGRDPRADQMLLAAMRATRQLVLPYERFFVDRDEKGEPTIVADLLGRPDAVHNTGVTLGFDGLPLDVDRHNRRADYAVDLVPYVPVGEKRLIAKTFAFAAANLARGGALARDLDELPTASRRRRGGQTKRTTWIDYRGGPGTIERVSALDVLDGRAPARAFRNKLVVIGVTARGNVYDVHRTPLDEGRGMLGVEVQANALDTMLRHNPLRDASSRVNVLLIVVLACIPALASLTRSRRLAAAAIVGAALGFLVAAQLAFHAGWVIAVVLPLAALVAAACGVALLAAGRMVRRQPRRVPTL
jgi:CHASE2 domain-containing sensor protein